MGTVYSITGFAVSFCAKRAWSPTAGHEGCQSSYELGVAKEHLGKAVMRDGLRYLAVLSSDHPLIHSPRLISGNFPRRTGEFVDAILGLLDSKITMSRWCLYPSGEESYAWRTLSSENFHPGY